MTLESLIAFGLLMTAVLVVVLVAIISAVDSAALTTALSGRRANRNLRRENAELKTKARQLTKLLEDQAANPHADPLLMGLLNQVLATDRVYPQLPEYLRKTIEDVVQPPGTLRFKNK